MTHTPKTSVQPNALSRGLHLLQAVSSAPAPLRFSDCRALLPGIGDSTLARLLQALESSGYLTRADNGDGYTAGPALCQWRQSLRAHTADFATLARSAVTELIRAADESAAVCLLVGERIVTVASYSVPGGIRVLNENDTLYFEADHAAALVILKALPAASRKALLAGPYSRIANSAAWTAGIQAALWTDDGLCCDRSLERPGISRVARGFVHQGQPGAVFYCVTTERSRQAQQLFSQALTMAAATLNVKNKQNV